MLIENVFSQLLKSSQYFRIVYPHIRDKYFVEREHKIIFNKVRDFHNKYNKQPSIPDIKLMIEGDNNISEDDSETSYKFLDSLKTVEKVANEELLIRETEQFCQNRALENAILESVDIIQKGENKGAIEDKIKEALGIEFQVKIGHDFFKDAPVRYQKYIEEEEIIPTDIELINTMLNGGFRKKSIHCFIGRVNIGKSLILCHLAACMLKQGRDVLYISAEMSEDMISKRIDANLLDIEMNSLNRDLDKKMYLSKVKDLFDKTKGKLIVKEYPTGTATANHIRNLLNEIKLKKGYLPEVVILDYLNIFGSSRLSGAGMANSYNYIKSIAEEMRGVAVEFDLAIITASQVNRSNANNKDLDMTATSESFGLPMTMDFMAAIIQTPELFEQNKYLLKVIKSRYNDNINQVVTVGVERPKMRLVNLSDADQEIPLNLKDKLKRQEAEDDFVFD